MSRNLTAAADSLQAALALLRERPGLTCTEIGETLWSGRYGCRMRQCYARPAGKLMKRAIAAKLARQEWERSEALSRGRVVVYHRRVFFAIGAK